MRVVLNTNVLIAAFLARGACREVFETCAIHHTIVLSEGIMAEFVDTVQRKFKGDADDARKAAHLIRERAELVVPAVPDPPVCRDVDNDMVLGTAVAGHAEVIVTGDKDLLVLDPYGSLAIIPPSGFWRFEHDVLRGDG